MAQTVKTTPRFDSDTHVYIVEFTEKLYTICIETRQGDSMETDVNMINTCSSIMPKCIFNGNRKTKQKQTE